MIENDISANYTKSVASQLIGTTYKCEFCIDPQAALTILRTYAPEKISDAVDHYTIDNIKGRTFLLCLTSNDRVNDVYELEPAQVDSFNTLDPITTYELLKDCEYKDYKTLNKYLVFGTIFMVAFALIVLNIIM